METHTELEYSYEPVGFFEAETVVDCSIGTLRIWGGKAVLTLQKARAIDHGEAAKITPIVKSIFHARQVLVHTPFRLVGPSVIQDRGDGRRDAVVLVEPLQLRVTGYAPDILITDATGGTVRDTKADRIAEQTAFVAAAAKKAGQSPTLRRMLSSYGAAVADPANELVYLYEMRDALAAHFGSRQKAQHALGLTEADWSYVGRLANDAPVLEGRHRGKQAQPLRPAAEDELDAARAIARTFIERFAATVSVAAG